MGVANRLSDRPRNGAPATITPEQICTIIARACEKPSESGVLGSLKTREAFLCDPAHRITFHFTPKHASWLNQIEIWFSVLARKVIRRGDFRSTEGLKAKIEAFIEYFNHTMAKPFRWTYKGRP